MKTYREMQIDEVKKDRRTINAVNELEDTLSKMKICKLCGGHFLPIRQHFMKCANCLDVGDNTYSSLE